MRATPKEMALRNDQAEMRDWILSEKDPRNIQELFHNVSVHTHGAEFQLGRTTIEILISEQQAKSSQTLESQTNALIVS